MAKRCSAMTRISTLRFGLLVVGGLFMAISLQAQAGTTADHCSREQLVSRSVAGMVLGNNALADYGHHPASSHLFSCALFEVDPTA